MLISHLVGRSVLSVYCDKHFLKSSISCNMDIDLRIYSISFFSHYSETLCRVSQGVTVTCGDWVESLIMRKMDSFYLVVLSQISVQSLAVIVEPPNVILRRYQQVRNRQDLYAELFFFYKTIVKLARLHATLIVCLLGLCDGKQTVGNEFSFYSHSQLIWFFSNAAHMIFFSYKCTHYTSKSLIDLGYTKSSLVSFLQTKPQLPNYSQ